MPLSIKKLRINCGFMPFFMSVPLEIIRRKKYPKACLNLYNKLFLKKSENLTVFTEADFADGLTPKSGSLILQGYFQDYEVFEPYRDMLMRELQPRKVLNTQNESYLRQIADVNSVAVHLRRGVYVTDARIRSQYPDVSLEYYQKAIEIISSKIQNPYFFIFSNDCDWVKQTIKNNFKFNLLESGGPDYEHLYLMSQCKHHIITNSTFSWWGAWLNSNAEQIVIAPKDWEKNHARIPDSWIRMDNGK